jgi:hypothetical protein
MTARIQCRTVFDITATGVRNHTSSSRLPFQDRAGQQIATNQQWVKSRNQQRNWETVNQILALRTLPENLSEPQKLARSDGHCWQFEFDIPDLHAVSEVDQPLILLLRDCHEVPMITGLDEDPDIKPVLCSQEPGANIWFEVIS